MLVHHILVRHQYEAEDLLKRLKRGEDFFQAAQKHSLCPSGPAGGLLGALKKIEKKLDPDFLEGLAGLEPDQVSKPVRTRFGYHLILLKQED